MRGLALGAFLLLTPKAMLVMIGIFAAVLIICRYVSLGSILAVALFPFLAVLFDGYRDMPQALTMMALASILIIAKHHANIRRLLAGTETRFGRSHA